MKKILVTLISFYWSIHAYGQTAPTDFDEQIQKILNSHYTQFKNLEYFSGGSLSIYVPHHGIKNFYVGKVSHESKSKPVTSATLFQIGDITKTFTAAMILQLEKENKLQLTDTLKPWFPEYSKWSGIKIVQLLKMDSGIPNYSAVPVLNTQIYYNLNRIWTDKELIATVYPSSSFSPPLKTGYYFSNTGYILASFIIQKATHDTFSHQLTARTIQLANLNNTYYEVKNLGAKLQARMAHGYQYNQYENPQMVGKDIHEGNLSWASAAGGAISNTQDLARWVKALYFENKILNSAQLNQFMSWFPLEKNYFQGQTLGFRSFYWYKTCNGVIITAAFNSATNLENDHLQSLLTQVYQAVIANNPQLNCQD